MSLAATFAVPGNLETPTGGYAYDRRMIAELRRLGWRIDVLALGDGFPDPSAQVRADALTTLADHAGRGPVVIDGLALGVLPEVASLLAGRRAVVALVHHPLALETGLSRVRADALRQSERAALADVQSVIVTSPATAELLAAEYEVAPGRLAVALPGNDPAPRAIGSGSGCINLLAVGSLVPRKGYDILIAALGHVRELDWRLSIVGDSSRSPDTARALADQVRQSGQSDRITLAGAVSADALTERYVAADLFVLASRFEGYGMAYAEAIAHGLPVIGTLAGATPGTVPPGAGLLVPPDDVSAFSAALKIALTEPVTRRQWADAAWAAGQALPTWEQAARTFDTVLRTAR